MSLQTILDKYRQIAFSERDKGDRFERLMQAYLLTDPQYASRLQKVWLWGEFPYRKDLGGNDTGVDLVALTNEGEYWAVQSKFFQADATIDKARVDSFLSTSSRSFKDDQMRTKRFSHRLWISTTAHWGVNAEEAIQNQNPPLSRIGLADLNQAPVDWDALERGVHGAKARQEKKSLRAHQQEALEKARAYYQNNERGKLIMACGTGKTFTSLRIAEQETQGKGTILFLVPSIALLGQALREWSADAQEDLFAICICSDPQVSKRRENREDLDALSVTDLALPASTDPQRILEQFEAAKRAKGMTVVFSTYQSIEVVHKAQKTLLKNGFGAFDLIVCDEAHRTTGVTLAGEDEKHFVKVHDSNFIRAKKRLYMTATPRLYSDDAKSKAKEADALLASMDDEKLYGAEIYRIGFGEAVEQGLLTDYKVLILTLSDKDVPPAVQRMISQEQEIPADDLTKLTGCLNALSKQFVGDGGETRAIDPEPMRRAVAFCANIKDSKKIADLFNQLSAAYPAALNAEEQGNLIAAEARHMDGTMSAPKREDGLNWIKETAQSAECRILTNVRVLSEGVDVPSLDAVLFLSAKNSQVDVVQSVGRVMRRAEGKQYGYIVIPVVIPADATPESALNDNERYKAVWTVLNALRAHDDRFNATVNKIELNKKRPSRINVVGMPERGAGAGRGEETYAKAGEQAARQLEMQFEQLQSVIFARLVQKVGDRRYWEQWAKDVAQIAERQKERIQRLIASQPQQRAAFANFTAGLQKSVNPSVDEAQAADMLVQHIVTQPVFEALFEGYSFVRHNAVSQAMQTMLDALEEKTLPEESERLQKFYQSVRARAEGIDNAEGKQKIIVELYDKFFKTAFPKMSEQLGIVYTPVEAVDFILRSTDDLLKAEFGRGLSGEGIHILDPFTGTGTFITRLLESGLIDGADLERKYAHELHANEIVLLAYYIAAVNIENAYHDATPREDDGIGKAHYAPFEGIVLTDSFQLGETGAQGAPTREMFVKNSQRALKQKSAPLRVIIGNPPYSVGQRSANDDAQNQSYPLLDNRIEMTYAKDSKATSVKALYDSYIKAFRWAADRLDPQSGGVIAFISNGGWLDGNGMDGFRKVLEREFSAIWVFNLRGNQRTSGELSRREGGKIFGGGSRAPITITFLIKNPAAKREKALIRYHDIGDYLSREEKLNALRQFKSVLNPEMAWEVLQPSPQNDWVAQRDEAFQAFIPLGDKDDKKNKSTFFVPNLYCRGLETSRDAWAYNSNKTKLSKNIKSTIAFFNSEMERYHQAVSKGKAKDAKSFVKMDNTEISWSRAFIADAEAGHKKTFSGKAISTACYRPFFKQHLYFNREINNVISRMDSFFPNPAVENLVICVSGIGGTKENTIIMTDCIPDLNCLDAGTQCFPLYYYEERDKRNPSLFDQGAASSEFVRQEGVSDFILVRARERYGKRVTKEDVFYYVYGFLHSPDYRAAFANDLKKSLPRLPLAENAQDFWAFSKAGRALAALHVGYEGVSSAPGVLVLYGGVPQKEIEKGLSGAGMSAVNYRVEKMRFPAKGQRDKILYNSQITVENIPLRAYEYVVNGKSAIEWVMERYQITTHKESGIVNDPNDWAQEQGDPKYILDLLLSVISVSVQTVEIVGQLSQATL